jgi:hypothetical protein
MIRLILRKTFSDNISGAHGTEFETLDLIHDELEGRLTSGGWGENGHCRTELVGAEVLPTSDKDARLGVLDTTLSNEEWVRKVAIEAQSRGMDNITLKFSAHNATVHLTADNNQPTQQ